MGVFQRLRERLVYRNKWIELYDDDVRMPSGSPGTFTRLRYRENPSGVVIVPRLPDGRFFLLRAFRYAVNEISTEFPRGMAEPGETAEAAGRRELYEETGLVATTMTVLGSHWPDTSIVETRVVMWLAEVASLEALKLDTNVEGIGDYVTMTAAQMRTAIVAQIICDGFTLGAFGLLAAREESREEM